MKIEQKKWSALAGWEAVSKGAENKNAQLVLAFGDRSILNDPKRFEELKRFYPKAHIVLASTSGNILGVNIFDQAIVSTAITFEKSSTIRIKKINIKDAPNSFEAGKQVMHLMPKENLRHVFLLSDGHRVNGSELVKGIVDLLPQSISLTGGLAGDGINFKKTIVGLDAPPTEGEIVVIGFYGPNLKFGVGSVGGWDAFGVERIITRSSGNILYELDGKSALELYKKYLGEQAKELPSSALLFPLTIRQDASTPPLVRTILSIDEKEQSMIFAGDIPEGWHAQLMKANFDRLIDGAFQAANHSLETLGQGSPDLAILISCVGRRLVLGQRTEDEIKQVEDVIGNKAIITGFYSYGEIAPTAPQANCELHNQTMTITTITER